MIRFLGGDIDALSSADVEFVLGKLGCGVGKSRSHGKSRSRWLGRKLAPGLEKVGGTD